MLLHDKKTWKLRICRDFWSISCKLNSSTFLLLPLLLKKTKQIKLDRILITFNSRSASPPGDQTCQHNKIVDSQVTTVQCWNWNCYKKNNSTTGKINCPHNLSLYLIRTCYKLFICLINFSFCPRRSEVIPTPPVALLLPGLLVDIEYQLQEFIQVKFYCLPYQHTHTQQHLSEIKNINSRIFRQYNIVSNLYIFWLIYCWHIIMK